MSFYCHAKNEIVQNVRRELIPVEVRKVTYVGVRKPVKWSRDNDDMDTGPGISEGWEIRKVVAVSGDLAEEYKKNHPPVIVEGEKTVQFIKPPKKKFPFKKPTDDDDDKAQICRSMS